MGGPEGGRAPPKRRGQFPRCPVVRAGAFSWGCARGRLGQSLASARHPPPAHLEQPHVAAVGDEGCRGTLRADLPGLEDGWILSLGFSFCGVLTHPTSFPQPVSLSDLIQLLRRKAGVPPGPPKGVLLPHSPLEVRCFLTHLSALEAAC